jgi:hypothetical protein
VLEDVGGTSGLHKVLEQMDHLCQRCGGGEAAGKMLGTTDDLVKAGGSAGAVCYHGVLSNVDWRKFACYTQEIGGAGVALGPVNGNDAALFGPMASNSSLLCASP